MNDLKVVFLWYLYITIYLLIFFLTSTMYFQSKLLTFVGYSLLFLR